MSTLVKERCGCGARVKGEPDFVLNWRTTHRHWIPANGVSAEADTEVADNPAQPVGFTPVTTLLQ